MAPRQLPDHVLRETLRDRDNLRDLLGSALPNEIANFDFLRLEELPRDLYTGDWREREADLIFEIGYRVTGGTVPSVVGVLVEHQTDTDRTIPFRALLMLVNYWERRWRQWEQTEAAARRPVFTLPPVFSVVLYTANLPWGSTTNVRELLAEPQALHRYCPDWGPQFWNLAVRTADELLAGPPWMQLMAALRVTGAPWPEYERVLARAARGLSSVAQTAHSRWSLLVRALLAYSLFRRPTTEHPQVRQILERENPAYVEEVRTMEKTMAQVWEEQAELRAVRRALLKLVRSRMGGQSPEQLVQQIEASTNLKQLEDAFDRALALKDMTGFRLSE